MKVANKISLSFLITAVILTSISISIVYIAVKNKFEEQIFDHLMTAAQSRADHLETFLEEQKETVEQITVIPTFKELLITSKNNPTYNQKLEQTIEALGYNVHDEFYEIFLLDKNGTIVSSANRGSIGHDKSNDPYFLNAKETTYIKDAYYSTTNGKSSIAVSSPIIDYKTNQLLGVIVARIETNKLNNITLDRTGLGETGEIYLVNKDYYMITPSRFKEDVFLKQKVDTENVRNSFLDAKRQKPKHKEIAIFADYRGINVVGTHVYIPETKWALLAEIDAKEAFEPLKLIQLIFLTILIVVPIIAWLVGIFVSRMISGPIHKLHKGTEVIASGNLDYKISIDTKDEIGQLSRAFDKMTENLKKTTASVIELNNEIIERQKAEEALRKSEERYREFVEGTDDLITRVDSEGRLIYVNQVAERIFGIGADQCIGMSAFDFVHHDDRKRTEAEFSRWVHNRLRSITIENRQVNKISGEVYHMLWTSNLHYDEKGNLTGINGIARDLTEKKKIEAQLQQTQKMEAIATLAGGIAHEFNNALTGVVGNIQLLEMDFADNKTVTEHTEAMKVSSQRMANLTSQLLAYARGGKYQAKTMSLSNFVEDTLPIIKPNIDPSIRLETDLPRDVFSVKADPAQMQMVLSSVVNNSAEAVEGEGRIRIITSNEEIDSEFAKNHPELNPGCHACLTVEDDGKGMEEETLNKIFDPFYTTKFMGRGLGMAAVYGIIRNHDGWVSVESEPDKGTVVRIYLPGFDDEEMEVLEKPSEEAMVISGTGTILVIEDEETVMNVIRDILYKLGYRMLEAKTGKEAIEFVKTFDGDIDLALLDIKLPDIWGDKVYPQIMEARPDLKVIVCSGHSIDGPAQTILDAGAQDFIQKPFKIETLSQKLKKALDGN